MAADPRKQRLSLMDRSARSPAEKGASRMNGLDGTTSTPTAPVRRACLVDGCTCKDARIVSHRRAAYFAVVARANGQTADRVISVDPEWRLPATGDAQTGLVD